MLSGIFTVWFKLQDTKCNGQALVVLPGDGTVYGLDQTFTYVGTVAQIEKGGGEVHLTATRYMGEPDQIFGQESEIEANLEGIILINSASSVSFTLFPQVNGPGLKLWLKDVKFVS